MSNKKKLSLSGAFYFILLLILSFVLIVLEGVYLNPQVSGFLIPLTVAIFAGTGAYLGNKRHERISGTGSDHMDKRIAGAFKDDELSEEYSKDGQRLLGKNVEVYRQLNGDLSRTWSPAFSLQGKTPKVVVSETFFFGLNPGERRALMVHEIYHYVNKDMVLTYLLTLLFVLSVGGTVISLVAGVLYGTYEDTYVLIGSFLLASIALIGILKFHLLWQEYEADKCTVRDVGGSEDIKAVIKKASEYAKIHTKEEKNKRIEVLLMRRLRHLGS